MIERRSDRLPTAHDIVTGTKAGRTSCVEVAEETLDRIKANQSLNAFITVSPTILADAEDLDRQRGTGIVGPLHGVPIAIKDNIETRDMRTTAGAVAFGALRTGRDAPVVARLRTAGALIVGKTNLDELAIAGRGQSGIGGQTLSPHDGTRHPAGSSGGSAVAVATGMAALALGTETVNSLRYPASATGTVAIRSGRGDLDRRGVFPQSALTDVVGPMARTVGDALMLFDALRNDGAMRRVMPVISPRIGLMRSMMGRNSEHRGVNAVLEAALSRYNERGATIIELDEPDFASALLYDRLAVQVYEVAGLFEAFLADLAARDGVSGLGSVRSLSDVLEQGPHAPLVAPFVKAALSSTAADRTVAVERRVQAARDTDAVLRALFVDQGLDAIVYPICHRPAARPIGEPSRAERNGVLASALGWPAIDLPVGVAEEDGTILPVGIDLTAPPEHSDRLFRIAMDLEAAIELT